MGQVDRGHSAPPELGDNLELTDRCATQQVNLRPDRWRNLVQTQTGGTEETLLPSQVEATLTALPGAGRNRFSAARAGLHPAASASFHRFPVCPRRRITAQVSSSL
jgi:hypothetical protein